MRACFITVLTALAVALGPAAANAATIAIGFDDLPFFDLDPLTNEYAPAASFSNASIVSLNPDISLNGALFPPTSSPNAASNLSGLDPNTFDPIIFASPFTITFGTSITAFRGYFTHADSLTFSSSSGGGTVPGDNLGTTSLITVIFSSPITQLTIGSASVFTLDDIEFVQRTGSGPEPATLALLALGVAMVVRRRHSA